MHRPEKSGDKRVMKETKTILKSRLNIAFFLVLLGSSTVCKSRVFRQSCTCINNLSHLRGRPRFVIEPLFFVRIYDFFLLFVTIILQLTSPGFVNMRYQHQHPPVSYCSWQFNRKETVNFFIFSGDAL